MEYILRLQRTCIWTFYEEYESHIPTVLSDPKFDQKPTPKFDLLKINSLDPGNQRPNRLYILQQALNHPQALSGSPYSRRPRAMFRVTITMKNIHMATGAFTSIQYRTVNEFPKSPHHTIHFFSHHTRISAFEMAREFPVMRTHDIEIHNFGFIL